MRAIRLLVLGVVLAATAFALPDATVQPEEVLLVKVKQAAGVDAGADDGVLWILAVGSDARRGQDMTRSRGDALQMIGINTRTGAATSIGVPRDSWVAIPGFGSEKINASLYFGGPALMAESMANLTGITPDYVFVTRFEYFRSLVRSIGGIEVDNPRAFSDPYLKVAGFPAGRIHLTGYDAMAFGRIRKSLPAGDFDRSANQQRVLQGIARKVRARAAAPGFLERGVLATMRNTSTDLAPGELFRLANAVAQIDPTRMTGCVVQGGIGSVGAQSVVFPNVADAQRYGREAEHTAVIKSC